MSIDEFVDSAIKCLLALKDLVKDTPSNYPDDTEESEWIDQLLTYIDYEPWKTGKSGSSYHLLYGHPTYLKVLPRYY